MFTHNRCYLVALCSIPKMLTKPFLDWILNQESRNSIWNFCVIFYSKGSNHRSSKSTRKQRTVFFSIIGWAGITGILRGKEEYKATDKKEYMGTPHETSIKISIPEDSQPTNDPCPSTSRGKKTNKFSSMNCNILKFHLNAALLKKQKRWAIEKQAAL